MLLSKGANVNLLNNSLCTALHIAVNKGFTDMVRVLTEHSADVNLQVRRPGGTLANVYRCVNIYVGSCSSPLNYVAISLLKCKSVTIPDSRRI